LRGRGKSKWGEEGLVNQKGGGEQKGGVEERQLNTYLKGRRPSIRPEEEDVT